MRRTILGDASIAVEFRGAGQPVLLIHGTVAADGLLPIAEALAPRREYLLIRYHRRGYGGSSPIPIPWSVEQHATDAARLIDQLGIRKAHVIGHSAGAAVAMELALDFPQKVGSMVLLEPWLAAPANWFTALEQDLAAIQGIYESGQTEAALDSYLNLFCGPDHRKVLDRALPAAWHDVALHDADTLFLHELGALRLWQLNRSVAERITKPMLLVRGDRTSSFCADAHRELADWFPDAQTVVLPGAGHMLPSEKPDTLARIIARFLARNPMSFAALAS